MGTDLAALATMIAAVRARHTALRAHRDAGYSTEAVVVIALLAVAAITVVGIIVGKVVAKANSINLG